MKNQISQTLNIGDRITYTLVDGCGKRHLLAGEIIGFTDKKIKCAFVNWYENKTLPPDYLTVV